MRIAIAILVATLLSAGDGAASMRNWILAVGSSTVFPLASLAAERFARETNHRAPVIEASGTGGGFDRFCQGLDMTTPDIVNASRRMHESEWRKCRENDVRDIVEIPIGFDGIVALRAAEAAPLSITHGQLWLALGETVPFALKWQANPFLRWREIDLGLPDERIRIYGPPPTSGTRDVLSDDIMQASCAAAAAVESIAVRPEVCRRIREDGAYVNAMEADDLVIQRVRAERAAIGLVGFNTYFRFRTLVRAVPIDGIAPDHDTIYDHTYPLSRSLFVYVKKAHVGQVDGLRDFLLGLTRESAIGPDGYLADRGLVPLDDAGRAQARKRAETLAPALSFP